jgi:hypothetical protein
MGLEMQKPTKSHFWKIFLLWYLLLLSIFALYHWQVTHVRTQDFKIKKTIFQEYQVSHQLPAYLSLSKADYHSSRYHKNRDELLRSGELSGYTLNQIDELIKVKEDQQFWLSILMWLGVFLLFVGFVLWLRLLMVFILSFFKKEYFRIYSTRFIVASILIGVAFSSSKFMASKFRNTISSDYDFEQAMQVALKVDDYYQRVIKDFIDVSNLFFKQHEMHAESNNSENFKEIENRLLNLKKDLKAFQGLQSSFINFDGVDLVRQTDFVCESILKVVNSASQNVYRDNLVKSLTLYQAFVTQLLESRDFALSEQVLSLFTPRQIMFFDSLSANEWKENPNSLYYGYFLYQALRASIR